MKKDTHPTNHPVVFVDTSCGAEFVTTSTMTSEATKQIDGVDHYVINLEVSSASHPFYTGKQVLVDTARRVEKFKARQAKQEAAAKARKGKAAKKAARKEEEEGEAEAPKAKKTEKKKEAPAEPKVEEAPVEAVTEDKAEEVVEEVPSVSTSEDK